MPDKSSPLMRKGASLAGALLAGSLLLSACGSDSSSDDTSNESTETTETTETTDEDWDAPELANRYQLLAEINQIINQPL